MTDLAASYAHCRSVARSRAKNFYYAFLLLDRERRDAMCAMYAFMRYCDDLSDEAGATRAALEQWRGALEAALAGAPPEGPVWPAFLDTVRRYGIPHRYFHEMIDGVESDLEPVEVATFAELYAYCYRVASVVGLTTIHIFGFSDQQALVLAEKCGIAFQLTNVMRDIREDAGLGRRYLPAEDFVRFGVAELRLDEASGRMLEFEIERAAVYYRDSEPLLGMTERASRPALWAMIAIYRGIMEKIAENPLEVLRRRVSLSMAEKVWILARAAAWR